MATTVLIVDDHTAFRSRARRMLEAEGFEVVGEAGDGASGVAAARRLTPDVVLLDLQLPDTTGFAVAQEIAGDFAVVITSTHDDEDIGAMARRSGACGFVSKSELSAPRSSSCCPESSGDGCGVRVVGEGDGRGGQPAGHDRASQPHGAGDRKHAPIVHPDGVPLHQGPPRYPPQSFPGVAPKGHPE